MSGDPDGAEEAIYQAAARLPHDWMTRKLVEVSADGRTVRLEPATRVGAVLWTDRPWSSAAEHVGESVRFHEFTGVLLIGEGAAEVGEDFEAKVSDTWPAVIFQQLIDAYPALDVHPLSLEQAQEMGWPPRAADPPFEHLWRPVDLSTD